MAQHDTPLDDYWHATVPAEVARARPDFRFDAQQYLRRYPSIGSTEGEARRHFETYGRAEGRVGTAYGNLIARAPDAAKARDMLASLIRDPALRARAAAHGEDGLHLAYEIMALGEPLDRRLTNFSARHYGILHPDVAKSGVLPIEHFLNFGQYEGRQYLGSVVAKCMAGDVAFDPAKPIALIGVHEFSRSGAPIVGLELMRQARATHNVIGLALRGGPLVAEARAECCKIMITETPAADLPYVLDHEIEAAELAVLNSTECWAFLPALRAADVPTAAYLHEFTNYTLPLNKPLFMAGFSDLLVYSSETARANWTGILSDLAVDTERDTLILPQRHAVARSLPAETRDRARKAIEAALGRSIGERPIVVGAGQVSARKGTDAFVMAAQLHAKRDPDVLYVWIGSDWTHEDLTFGVWMDARIAALKASPSADNFYLLPAGPHYRDLLAACRVFFLSSVLDPLPNVVFDAMEHDCDIVYFSGATGFDDASYSDLPFMHPVAHGDLGEAVERIAALLQAPQPADRATGTPRGEEAGDALFGTIASALRDTIARRRSEGSERGAETTAPVPRTSVMYADSASDDPRRRAERDHLDATGRAMLWRSAEQARAAIARSEHIAHAKTQVVPLVGGKAGHPPFNLHLHAHYTDDFGETIRGYKAFAKARELVVTTDTAAKRDRLRAVAKENGVDADVRVRPNRGRDILPFLDLVAPREPGEVWGHLHLKESRGTLGSGAGWRSFLFDILLGDADGFTNTLVLMQDPAVGLSAPLDPNRVGWLGNRRLFAEMEPRLPFSIPDPVIAFPVGNMFFCRSDVVAAMMDIFGTGYPWPREPIANDGTVYHFIERLWPAVTASCGLDTVFVDAPHLGRN